MDKYYVFCDESGTHHKNDGSSHFIYSAVLISEEDLSRAKLVRDEISRDFLSGSKIKGSSRALKNLKTRINILQYLCDNLSFKVYSLIIDKSSLDSEGLTIKKVFIKYFQNLLYSKIQERHPYFIVYMDSTGTDSFQIDLKKYLLKNIPEFQYNLFSQENKFFLKSDDEEPLIQLADLFSNTLLKIYSKSHKINEWEKLYNVIKDKILKPHIFPFNTIFTKEDDNSEYKVNTTIYNDVLENVKRLDRTDKIQNVIIDYLVYISKIFPQKLIETYELNDELKRVLSFEISIDKIRVYIRDLRYKGILIISKSGKSGYKLAVNESDISSYFQHYLRYIIPMLEKVNIADENLKFELGSDSYKIISKFLRALKQPD